MSANSLPVELVNAARSLEDRFQLLGVPSHRVAEAEWISLPESIKRVIPSWILQVLTQHSVAGGVLEYRDRKDPYVRQFAFFEPSDYADMFQEGSLFLRLVEFGFVPFANEANGNVWLMVVNAGPASPVHLLELSDWSGDQPHEQNGLVFACRNLAVLLAGMGISEASYYDASVGPRSVMWGEDNNDRQSGFNGQPRGR